MAHQHSQLEIETVKELTLKAIDNKWVILHGDIVNDPQKVGEEIGKLYNAIMETIKF